MGLTRPRATRARTVAQRTPSVCRLPDSPVSNPRILTQQRRHGYFKANEPTRYRISDEGHPLVTVNERMVLREAEAVSSREIEEIDPLTVFVPMNWPSQRALEHPLIVQAGASAEAEHLRAEDLDLRLRKPGRFRFKTHLASSRKASRWVRMNSRASVMASANSGSYEVAVNPLGEPDI